MTSCFFLGSLTNTVCSHYSLFSLSCPLLSCSYASFFFQSLSCFLRFLLSFVGYLLFFRQLTISKSFHQTFRRDNITDKRIHTEHIVLFKHTTNMIFCRLLSFLTGTKECDHITILCTIAEIVTNGWLQYLAYKIIHVTETSNYFRRFSCWNMNDL